MDDTHIPEQEAVVKIPINMENIREEMNFYRSIRAVFREYAKNTDDIDFILRNLEESALMYNHENPALPDEERIMQAIEKHPYFKNPCDYPIRLITILKYLKRKGFNMNYADIDLYVDKLVQRMDGVRKVGRGLYMRK